MNDRRRTKIVLGGLLALVSACKDEASEPATGAPAAAAPAAIPSAEGPEAGAPAKVDASPVAAEPPPAGHAVAKAGSLLFFSSKGDVGFELPPMGVGERPFAPGMTVNVVGEQDGRLVVETLVSEPAEHHCAATLDGLADFRLRLYLAAADLLPVLTEDFEHDLGDGTKVRLARGVPVPAGSTELVVRHAKVRVPVPPERIGRFYEPGQPFALEGEKGKLYDLEGHGLTYGGQTLDEPELYGGLDGIPYYGSTEREHDALIVVRNPCLEVTALVSNERLHAPFRPGPLTSLALGHGSIFAAPPGTGTGTEEDVWGGLTGTEIGETYGVGGLGLVGTGGGGEPSYEVKAGAAIAWADGGPAGQVTADHRFETKPRDEGGRTCFDVPVAVGQAPTVTLCFAPGDVGEIAAPSSGVGMYGLGSGSGSGLIGTGGGSSTRGPGFGSRGKRVPRVRQAKADVKGALDKDIIRRIVRAHINEVRYCYNQGLARDPMLKGRVSIEFTIGVSGKVSVASVADSTLGDADVDKCIALAVKRWTFPKPTGGGVVVVTYPFVLEPG
jgi:TonB family protein